MFPCADVVVDPLSLVRIGHALMARVQTVYAQAGVALPSRQIWIAGDGVYDCEQLIVSFQSLREGLIDTDTRSVASPSRPCETTIMAVFKITVVRCIPVPDSRGNPPSAQEVSDATDVLATDAYLLMKSGCKFDMYGADIEPPLHPSALGGMGVDLNVEVEEAQGGMQAVSLNLTTIIG
jgi:hypothetical protein